MPPYIWPMGQTTERHARPITAAFAARAARYYRNGMWMRRAIPAAVLALALAAGLASADAATPGVGQGTSIVGGAAVIPPLPQTTRPALRPAPIPRAPTVVTPRPRPTAPRPGVPADPTPILQPPPFRTNTPAGAQPGSGAPLGVLPGGLATPLVGPAPAPNTCWFYTTPAKTVGYWSRCP